MGKVISIMITILIAVVGISVLSSITQELPEDSPESVRALAGVLPIVYGIAIIIGVFTMVGGGSEVYKYIRYRKWREFGNRMKEAYTAKFGYSNPAFNQEVDQHIKAMEALGDGPTKTVNEDWLKRMAGFVEIPYIIPEEERLSEEEKTSQFTDKVP